MMDNMLCSCEPDAMASVQRLQSLIALETMLDDELDELERQYSLNLLKLDWLQKVGHQDLCDVITKNIDKTESLLRIYRPMLQDACAEKMELVQSIMDRRAGEEAQAVDNHDTEYEMEDGEDDHLLSTMSKLSDEDELSIRYT